MRITREELGVRVRLTDPTLLPQPHAAAGEGRRSTRLGEPRLASGLEKLGTIFGGYSEWGQPVHDVGNDVRILGLPIRRPDTAHAFRMLCRHNKYVQEFGRVRDPDEVARRERCGRRRSRDIERETGHEAGAHPAAGVPAAARRAHRAAGLPGAQLTSHRWRRAAVPAVIALRPAIEKERTVARSVFDEPEGSAARSSSTRSRRAHVEPALHRRCRRREGQGEARRGAWRRRCAA